VLIDYTFLPLISYLPHVEYELVKMTERITDISVLEKYRKSSHSAIPFRVRTEYQKVGTIHKHGWLDKPFAWDTDGYDLAVPTWDFIKVIPGQMAGRFEDVTTPWEWG
jgi:hypothetical protein